VATLRIFVVKRGSVAQADVGVIGGSGLYEMEGLVDVERIDINTPFGRPSDSLTLGTLSGVRVAFLPRHGIGHRLLPSELPSRANIYALKVLGVRHVISASAVGSLREDMRPMDMVIPDQLFDRTKGRDDTFFGGGIVAHVAFARPFCSEVSRELAQAAERVVQRTHKGGTYVCIEGPTFSTFAESTAYRSAGFDIIGMTALPEAKLAREAELCYAVLSQVTDYDCWHESHEAVTSEMVMQNVARNVANAREIIRRVVPLLPALGECSCERALQGAIVTSPEAIPDAARLRLAPILNGALAVKS
jgi:5'-methylthioadenosine phosphorylase